MASHWIEHRIATPTELKTSYYKIIENNIF